MNEQMKQCANCPNMLPPQAKFCTKCGTKVEAAAPPPPPPPPPLEKGPDSSGAEGARLKRMLLGALVLICVFGAGLLVMKMVGGRAPTSTQGPKEAENGAAIGKPQPQTPVVAEQKPPQPVSSTSETRILDEAEQAIAASRKIAKHIGPLFDLLKTGSPGAHDRAKALLLGLTKNHALMAKLGNANIDVLLTGLAPGTMLFGPMPARAD